MTRSSRFEGARFLIVQAGLIAFAVALGFAVTNWGQARRDRHRASVAVDRITVELQKNAAQLALAAPYYARMQERLDSIRKADGDIPLRFDAIPGWHGLGPPRLRRASFDVAMATGALGHVDVALVDDIALAYDVQGELTHAIDDAMSTYIAGNLTRLGQWEVAFGSLAELAKAADKETTHVLRELPGDTAAADTAAAPAG